VILPPLVFRAPALPVNISLEWKSFQGETLAYFRTLINYGRKIFTKLAPVVNVSKLAAATAYFAVASRR
jgi:hypothetical protein